jgi:hypothetical protein
MQMSITCTNCLNSYIGEREDRVPSRVLIPQRFAHHALQGTKCLFDVGVVEYWQELELSF